MEKFWQLVAVVLGAAIAAGAVKAVPFWAAELGWIDVMAGVDHKRPILPVRHPGGSRGHLPACADAKRRGGRHAILRPRKQRENWIKVAPHLLALWALCWMAVVLLTWLAVRSQCRSWLSRAHQRVRDDVVYHLRLDVAAHRPFS